MSEDKSDSFNDIVEQSDYGVIDIHKLGFKLLKENKKQYALLLLKVGLVISLFFIVFLSVIGITLNMPTSVMFTMLPIGMTLIPTVTAVVLWLCGSTIVKINTGIDTIENKKVNSSKLKTFSRIWVSCIICAGSVFLLSISYLGTSYFNYFQTGEITMYTTHILTGILYIAAQIMIVFIYCYVLFMGIDIIAKDSTVKESVKNVYINFIYSKNKIIKKVVAGAVLIIAIVLVINVLYSLCIFIVMNPPLINYVYMYSRVLVGFSSTVIGIILFLVSVFYLQYMYLVYMLNEVDGDKEIKKNKEITEVKKMKKSTIVIGSIVILISAFYLKYSYSVYITNEAENRNNVTEIRGAEAVEAEPQPVGATEAVEAEPQPVGNQKR